MLVARQRAARTENVIGSPGSPTSRRSKIDAAIARDSQECHQVERATAEGLGERFGARLCANEVARQRPHRDSSVWPTEQLVGPQLAINDGPLGSKTGTASSDVDRRRLASRITRAGGDATSPLDSGDVRQVDRAIAAGVRAARSFRSRGQRVLQSLRLSRACSSRWPHRPLVPSN